MTARVHPSPTWHCWARWGEGGGHSLAQAGEMCAPKAALCPSHCATAPAPGLTAGHTRMAGTRELQHQPLSLQETFPSPRHCHCLMAAGGRLCQALKWNFSAGHSLILLQPLVLHMCSTCAPRLVLTPTSCELCPAGPVLCLTLTLGLSDSAAAQPSREAPWTVPLLLPPWPAPRAPGRHRDEPDPCCGMGQPLQPPGPFHKHCWKCRRQKRAACQGPAVVGNS